MQLSVAVAVPVLAGNKEAPQLTVIRPGQIITGTTLSPTVAEEEVKLKHFPAASAVAVIILPDAKVKPVFVHELEVTVVVPCETPPLKTSMIVPSASLLVPLTLLH